MCNDPKIIVYLKHYDEVRFQLPHFFNKLFNRVRTHGKLFSFLPREWYDEYRDKIEAHPILSKCIYRIPCKKCLGCQADRKNQWTARCVVESRQYKDNMFLTLTYREEDVPDELQRRDYQLFMKRLRKWCFENGKPSPRQYYRGEYGTKSFRPHFHTILFNFDISDKEILYYISKRGKKIYHAEPGATPYYTSKTLEDIWTHGFIVFAKVSRETFKYVANYLDKGKSPYAQQQPFNGMSRRPALGRAYYESLLTKGTIDEAFTLRDGSIGVRSIQYFRRKIKEDYPEIYSLLMEEEKSIAQGTPKPWEKTSLTEWEYLAQREERMASRIAKFKKHEDFSP